MLLGTGKGMFAMLVIRRPVLSMTIPLTCAALPLPGVLVIFEGGEVDHVRTSVHQSDSGGRYVEGKFGDSFRG